MTVRHAILIYEIQIFCKLKKKYEVNDKILIPKTTLFPYVQNKLYKVIKKMQQ